jgi:multidrug efflux pump subunit AcrB
MKRYVATAMLARIHMPESITGSFQGAAAAFQDSLASQPYLILAAIVAIYVVLGVLYESYITSADHHLDAASAGLPLMLGNGTGSELRRPLGLTLVGGLIVSQALTLFTTPVIYLYLDRLTRPHRLYDASASSSGPTRLSNT